MSDERIYPPMHPGRVLELEFLEPLGLTPYKLAKDLGVPPPRIYDVVRGKRGISADTALRLARYFGTSPQFWTNLQARYDLEIEKERVGDSIERAVHPFNPTDVQNVLDRAQIDMRSLDASNALSDIQQSLNALERLKSEAVNPLTGYDFRQIIEQVSAAKQPEGVAEALQRADVAKMDFNISDYAGSSAEQAAKTFSLLSRSEALTGVLQQSFRGVSDAITEAGAGQPWAFSDQMKNLFDSTGFERVLDNINKTLTESLKPEALDAARYLATEDFLQGGWLNLISQTDIQNAMSRLQENYSEVLHQIAELASDPRVREMVARADQEKLIADAAELLYQDELTLEQVEEVVYLGINSEELTSLSTQTLHKLGNLLIYFILALLAAQSVPEFAPYAQVLQSKILLVVALYSVLSNQGRLKKELPEEN